MRNISSQKAQSAMEYLMTYGWAILIVAIVLAALFSLGVFSSGALIGTTCIASPGFLCSVPIVQGTTFTATLGQSTGSMWTNTVFCFVPNGSPSPSSCSGYPSSTANTLLSGQTETHSFTIDSSSSSDSGSIWAQYSTDGYSGLMSELAIVTIKGLTATPSSSSSSSSSFALPSGVTYYANVVITNSQSTATPAPFQQEVQIPESDYSNYISYNGVSANFEFFYNGGSVIPAWIESNSSGTLTVWLNLANGIPASNSITVYIGFAPETTNLLSGSGTTGIGEAPQLSQSYAEYDDGASVFNNYWNFAGTSLPSGWGASTDYNGNVDNGLTVTSSYNWGGVAYGPITENPPVILDSYDEVTTAQAVNIGFSTSDSFSTSYSYYNSYQYGQAGTSDYTYADIGEGTGSSQSTIASGTLPIASNSGYNVYSAEFTPSGVAQLQDYASVDSGSSTFLTSASYLFISVYSGATVNVKWLRTRAYPPNGVMPSVAMSSTILSG